MLNILTSFLSYSVGSYAVWTAPDYTREMQPSISWPEQLNSEASVWSSHSDPHARVMLVKQIVIFFAAFFV